MHCKKSLLQSMQCCFWYWNKFSISTSFGMEINFLLVLDLPKMSVLVLVIALLNKHCVHIPRMMTGAAVIMKNSPKVKFKMV